METRQLMTQLNDFKHPAVTVNTTGEILAYNAQGKSKLGLHENASMNLLSLVDDREQIGAQISNTDFLGALGNNLTQLKVGQAHFQARLFKLPLEGPTSIIILQTYDNSALKAHTPNDELERTINPPMEKQSRLLRASEKLANLGHWRFDITTKRVFWSEEVFKIHGEDPKTFVPDLSSATQYYLDEGADHVRQCLLDAEQNLSGFEFTLRIRRRDGEVRWVTSRGNVDIDSAGKATSIYGIFQDCTDDINNQQALERLSLVASKTTNSVVICDNSGHIEWVNKGFEDLTGYPFAEVKGKSPKSFLHGPLTEGKTQDYIQNRLSENKPVNCDIVYYKKNGVHYWINLVITPIIQDDKHEGYIEIQTDISERKRSDQLVSQAQRMEAIGQLVGGVAHDFNNILGILRGNLELLEYSLKINENRYLGKSLHACDRATDLTKKLLQFSRFKPSNLKLVKINHVVHNVAGLLTKSLTQNVLLKLDLEENLDNVWCNTGDIEDVLFNLVINARDAMRGNGRVTITTKNVTLTNFLSFGDQTIPVAPGNYVLLSVKDTGPGIPEQIRNRVFEPFFSTKGNQGSGLGLSMIYGFVQRSSGHILIDSSDDIGAEIRIWLPQSNIEDEVVVSQNLPTATKADGRYRILIIDDEPDIVEIVSEYLSPLECELVTTTNPIKAQKWLVSETQFDLLVTDEVMPGIIKGHTLVKAAQHTNANIRSIVMSGYNVDLKEIEDNMDLLTKPFTRSELLNLVNKNLSLLNEMTARI